MTYSAWTCSTSRCVSAARKPTCAMRSASAERCTAAVAEASVRGCPLAALAAVRPGVGADPERLRGGAHGRRRLLRVEGAEGAREARLQQPAAHHHERQPGENHPEL